MHQNPRLGKSSFHSEGDSGTTEYQEQRGDWSYGGDRDLRRRSKICSSTYRTEVYISQSEQIGDGEQSTFCRRMRLATFVEKSQRSYQMADQLLRGACIRRKAGEHLWETET